MGIKRTDICIASVKSTALEVMGIQPSENNIPANSEVMNLANGRKADRVVIYNPDAIAAWLYDKHTEKFAKAEKLSGLTLQMRSVMPSVTPVCFASMYTGVMPEVHGITKYVKPVLQIETLFDKMLEEGKKCAIVSTTGDSISKIFLKRNMDYFILPNFRLVNRKALQLIKEDRYDLLVIYNPNYDSCMHATGPEGKLAMRALDRNLEFYEKMVKTIEKQKGHTYFYGFCPDHGCHRIDGGRGSHGLDMEEDMNVIHFYGIK